MSNTIKDIEETINWLEDRKWTLVEQDMERAKQEQIDKETREMYTFSVIPEARAGSVGGNGSIRINTETGEISGLDETEENASPEASETRATMFRRMPTAGAGDPRSYAYPISGRA